MIRRLRRFLAWVVLIAAGGVGVLLFSLWIEHTLPVTLPPLTGSFCVGRSMLALRDEGPPGTKPPSVRELLVWFWYPADGATELTDYLPEKVRAATTLHRGALISNFLTHDLAKVRSHARDNAAISARQPEYPVVLLRAGGTAEVWNYTSLAEDLASHGYIVVGIDAPLRTSVVVMPDGRVIGRAAANDLDSLTGDALTRRANELVADWSRDMSFALDRLTVLNKTDPAFAGHLDLTRVGVMGHSFGGAQAAQFCHDDPRCKAGIDIDGMLFGNVVKNGVGRPFLFVLSDHRREPAEQAGPVRRDLESVFNRLLPTQRGWVEIEGANHFFFSDDGALLKSRLLIGLLRLVDVVRIDGSRQLALTSDAVHRFFDAHLSEAERPSINPGDSQR